MALIYSFTIKARFRSAHFLTKNAAKPKAEMVKYGIPPLFADEFLAEAEKSQVVIGALGDLEAIVAKAYRGAIGSDALSKSKSAFTDQVFGKIVGAQFKMKVSDIKLEIHVKSGKLELWYYTKKGKNVVLYSYSSKKLLRDPENDMNGLVKTESDARTLLREYKKTVRGVKKKIDALKKQLDALDKLATDEEAFEDMGSARGEVVNKAKARGKSAADAAKLAKLFKKKLDGPKSDMEDKIDQLKEFQSKEEKEWSKIRNLTLPALPDIKSAIEDGEALIEAMDDEVPSFIRDKKQAAALSRMISAL